MLRTANGTSPRILVVDPHAKVAALIERYVLMSGALAVMRADSPLAALHFIQDHRSTVDCVVAAQDMAPISGIEFLRLLRSGRYGPGPSIRLIPFVLVMLLENPAVRDAASLAGSTAVIIHPFDRDALGGAIVRAMMPAMPAAPLGPAGPPDRDWSQRYHPDGVPEAFGHIDHIEANVDMASRAYVARTARDEATFPSLSQAEQWLKARLTASRRLVKG